MYFVGWLGNVDLLFLYFAGLQENVDSFPRDVKNEKDGAKIVGGKKSTEKSDYLNFGIEVNKSKFCPIVKKVPFFGCVGSFFVFRGSFC